MFTCIIKNIINSVELAKRSGSKVLKCNTHVDVKTRGKSGKVIQWPWKISCGICKKNMQLRYDSDLKGRISYFDRREYSLLYISIYIPYNLCMRYIASDCVKMCVGPFCISFSHIYF